METLNARDLKKITRNFALNIWNTQGVYFEDTILLILLLLLLPQYCTLELHYDVIVFTRKSGEMKRVERTVSLFFFFFVIFLQWDEKNSNNEQQKTIK